MSHSPTVRHRRLYRELKRRRESSELTLEQVAKRLGWSRAKVSRIETGRIRPNWGDVSDMLDLYGVKSPERDALITLAREAKKRGWWAAYRNVFTGSYIGLEDEASVIRSWEPLLINGLLQTPDYAAAVIRASRMTDTESQIAERVEARLTRQQILEREPPTQLHSLIDEAALCRPMGTPEIHRAQLTVVRDALERENVTVQVVPFRAGAHAGVDGPFYLLSFPDEEDPDVAYVEGTMGDVYLESAEEIAHYRLRFHKISESALSPEDSADLIAHYVKGSP